MAIHREIIRSLLDQQDNVVALLDHAAADPALLAQLAADPLGTAVAAGVRVTAADLQALLGLPGATDAELVEVLRARLANAHGASCGCGS
ncbi:MAG TPA: hypothetical protein VII06_28525 [Chloroflexota bacterium]|jgi:hypothetical protein